MRAVNRQPWFPRERLVETASKINKKETKTRKLIKTNFAQRCAKSSCQELSATTLRRYNTKKVCQCFPYSAPMTSSRGCPCQPLREKVVRSFEACTRPPIELQPPTSTRRRRRGQRRGVPRPWGLLSAHNSEKSFGPTQPAGRELSDFDAP